MARCSILYTCDNGTEVNDTAVGWYFLFVHIYIYTLLEYYKCSLLTADLVLKVWSGPTAAAQSPCRRDMDNQG